MAKIDTFSTVLKIFIFYLGNVRDVPRSKQVGQSVEVMEPFVIELETDDRYTYLTKNTFI